MINLIHNLKSVRYERYSYDKKNFLSIKLILLILSFQSFTTQKPHYYLLLVILLIILMELYKSNFSKNKYSYIFFSSLTIIFSSILLPILGGTLYGYFFFLSMEIVYSNLNIEKYYLLALQMLVLILILLFLLFNNYLLLNQIWSILITYISATSVIFILKLRKNDKKAIYSLNKELKEQNLKLQEYSLKVEELTLAKERNRVAQELHDSLGHYLMAISMHLDFLEKTIEDSPEKSLNTIKKTKLIVEESISDLRTTVYKLKENKVDTSFNDAIDSLIHNFSIGTSLNFTLNISPLIDNLQPNIKDIIYKTLKESLTNGIKHGNAKSFTISILLINNSIHFTINNIGTRGDKITMSNGLTGIKERIESYDGTVNFQYTNSGFKTAALINLPKIDIKKGDDTNDKNSFSR